MKLDREDMMEAVAIGVCRGIVRIGSRDGQFDIPDELLYDAIRQGVADAIWRIATNATDAPSADFYEYIKEGVREGVAQGGRSVEARRQRMCTRRSLRQDDPKAE